MYCFFNCYFFLAGVYYAPHLHLFGCLASDCVDSRDATRGTHEIITKWKEAFTTLRVCLSS